MPTIDRILELVNENGITAKEFAEKCGIAGGSITDWKTGRSKPSVKSLQKIADYTGVQLDWLTGNSEFKTKQDELDNYLEKEVRRTIWQCFDIFYDDYVVPANLNEQKSNELVEILSLISKREPFVPIDEIKKKLKAFLDSFDNVQKPIVKKFVEEITKQVLRMLNSHNKYYTLVKDIEQIDKKESNVFPSPSNSLYMCPVYGRIAAGLPNWAEECREGALPLDPEMMNIHNPEECFFLRVSGESMNQLIKNGSFALIHKQEDVENGDIAVVLVNGYDATLKKFTKKNDVVVLEPMSDDPSFETQIYSKETRIQILGKYIGKFEMR